MRAHRVLNPASLCFIYFSPLFLYLYSIWLWAHPTVSEGISRRSAGAKLRSKAHSSGNDSSWTDWFILKLLFVFKDTPFRDNFPPVCYQWQDHGHRLSVSALGREVSPCICLKSDIKTQGCCGNEVIIMLNFNMHILHPFPSKFSAHFQMHYVQPSPNLWKLPLRNVC